jgi:hypothetical protein
MPIVKTTDAIRITINANNLVMAVVNFWCGFAPFDLTLD